MLPGIAFEDRFVELLLVEEHQRDGVRELELHTLLKQVGREGKYPFLCVPSTDHRTLRLFCDAVHADPELAGKATLQVLARHSPCESSVAPKLLRPLLERFEPVVMLLEEVGDLVVGIVIKPNITLPRLTFALSEARRHVVELTARVLVQVEEGGDRRDHAWLGANARQVLLAQVQRAQERFVEESREAVVYPMFAQAPHEVLDRDPVQLERPKQKRELYDPLPLFDQAQIGRRDLESPGNLALLEASTKSKLP